MIDFSIDRRFRQVVFARGTELPKWALIQIIQSLPDDALLFHCDFDFPRNVCSLLFWSSEFDRVPFFDDVPSVAGWIDAEGKLAGLCEVPS